MDVGGKVAAPRTRETILLVDDDLAIVKITARVLEAQGYVVLRATLPSEALRAAADRELVIHMLLTDVMMPEMNGPDLAKALAAHRPQLKLLYMSGYAADVIGPRGVLDRGTAFIEKPFAGRQLAAKVREVLDA